MQFGDLLTLLQLSIGFNFAFGAFSQLRDQIFLSEEALIKSDRQYLVSRHQAGADLPERPAERVAEIDRLDRILIDAMAALGGIRVRSAKLEDLSLIFMLLGGAVGCVQLLMATLGARSVPDGAFVTVAISTNLPWIVFLTASFFSYLDVRQKVRKARYRFQEELDRLPAS